MVDRRCRRVIVLLLSAVILLTVGIENVYAALEDKGMVRFSVEKIPVKGSEKDRDIRFMVEELPPAVESYSDMMKAEPSDNHDEKTIIHSRGEDPEKYKEDVELLARIIHAEARGESFEGQIAVGAVVLNRVENIDFPETIREVIFQPGQFTAVDDGQIYLEPNNTSFKAAEAALNGQDPTNGALYYYNPRIATDRWIRTLPVVTTIGNHDFCSEA